MEPPDDYTLQPFGDSAALVNFGAVMDPALNARVHRLAAALRLLRAGGAALGVPVPAYSSLLIPYDALTLDFQQAAALLRPAIAASVDGATATEQTAQIEIAVRYGGADGPDLTEVAALHGLTSQQVVALHTASVYRVYMLGFAPGFAYLGPLPPELVTPRRASPRTRVPVGSVAIAGGQTGVYPLATPGGWQLIGRTDTALWDAQREPPALLNPGDLVRFKAI